MGARRNRQRRPTRNGMGWASERLNAINQEFVNFCASGACPEGAPALDIGAGYGSATVAALAAGAWVIANDLDASHLTEVERRAAAHHDRLRLKLGGFPQDLHFDPDSLGAVHASSVLHFLTGRKLTRGFASIARWLRPGGKLFVHAATPYQAPFAAFIPEFERRLAAGDQWPGWIERARDYSTHRLIGQMPSSLHLMNDSILVAFAESAGLVVESVMLYRRGDLPASLEHDGRESVGLIARRP